MADVKQVTPIITEVNWALTLCNMYFTVSVQVIAQAKFTIKAEAGILYALAKS